MNTPWGSFFNPTDGRGVQSRTLFFVALAITVVTARFVLGGIEFTVGPIHWAIAATSPTDYGIAFAAILAVWLTREGIDKKVDDKA